MKATTLLHCGLCRQPSRSLCNWNAVSSAEAKKGSPTFPLSCFRGERTLENAIHVLNVKIASRFWVQGRRARFGVLGLHLTFIQVVFHRHFRTFCPSFFFRCRWFTNGLSGSGLWFRLGWACFGWGTLASVFHEHHSLSHTFAPASLAALQVSFTQHGLVERLLFTSACRLSLLHTDPLLHHCIGCCLYKK